MRSGMLALVGILAITTDLRAQQGAMIGTHDIGQILRTSLSMALQDRYLVRTGSGSVHIDLEESVKLLAANARTPVVPAPIAPGSISPRLRQVSFFEYWDCPARAISVHCTMTGAGDFLTIYSIRSNETGDRIQLWISFTENNAVTRKHVHTVARSYTFARNASGEWRFVEAGHYIAS